MIHPRQAWRKYFKRLEDQFVILFRNQVEGCCDSLLDVGCGFNSPVQHLLIKPGKIIGVDTYEPVIDESRKKNIHNEYHLMDILKIAEQFPPKSVDCVIALDVIEHLTEENALKLIAQMESIARKKVIIYTPNGFLPQGEEYGNPWQRHISGWTAKQMKAYGYRVYGVQGLKFLRGEMARILWKPERLWYRISLLTQLFTQSMPSWAFRILCVKDMNGKV
jgi:2-polyprenyl-3-methyl-5-hydroxy-6-metoxy-1,4-benzoquinol methylase